MSELLSSYKNGSYNVSIFSDGTKIRETESDEFIPEFPETMDVCISTLCNNRCEFCYANCSPQGYNADFDEYFNNGFFDSIHPYTELAININSIWHPGLFNFLEKMKERNIIVNATISQLDFERLYDVIKSLVNKKLIWGLGVSLINPTKHFIELIKEFPNAVIHLINGIVSPDQIKKLSDNDLKILILGFKQVGRGINYYENGAMEIIRRQNWIHNNLHIMAKHFNIICFDNLALKQLDVKSLLTEESWNESYMGDDGLFSFYINLVDGTFSKNSLSDIHYPINGRTVTECFDFIRNGGKE